MKHEIDAVADRWSRRYARVGPWVTRACGPLVLRTRRRTPGMDYIRFWVATQRLWHLLRAGVLPIVRWLARRMG